MVLNTELNVLDSVELELEGDCRIWIKRRGELELEGLAMLEKAGFL